MIEDCKPSKWLRIPGTISDLIPFQIAVGVMKSGENQLHSGILYHYRNETRLLHLAWHFDLQHDLVLPSENKFYWIIPTIAVHSKSVALAARFRQFAEQNGKGFAYAPGRPFAQCNEDGSITLSEDCKGLTCASFVALLFEKAGQKIISIEEWQPRDSDREWVDKIISWMMKRKDVPEDHIQLIRSMKSPIRIRPEEIASGASYIPLPSGFKYAESEGEKLFNILNVTSQ